MSDYRDAAPPGSDPATAASAHPRRDLVVVILILLLGLAVFAWMVFTTGVPADETTNLVVTREEGNVAFPDPAAELNLGLPAGLGNGAEEAPEGLPEVNAR